MMIYSKTISDTDNIRKYVNMTNDIIKSFVNNRIEHYFQHPQRHWEYGMSMKAIQSIKKESLEIMDVGGAGSVFAPTIVSKLGHKVIQVDPAGHSEWVNKQEALLGIELPYIQKDLFEYQTTDTFDVVTAISVIEHVDDHINFIKRLSKFVRHNGLLIITTDFHPTGTARLPWHIRTYNEDSILSLKDSLPGFYFLGGGYDYNYTMDYVHNYTFASLILKNSN